MKFSQTKNKKIPVTRVEEPAAWIEKEGNEGRVGVEKRETRREN